MRGEREEAPSAGSFLKCPQQLQLSQTLELGTPVGSAPRAVATQLLEPPLLLSRIHLGRRLESKACGYHSHWAKHSSQALVLTGAGLM